MDSSYTSFTGSIPENYDKYLAKSLLNNFGEHLAEKVTQLNPKNILEVACGTGLVTKKMADALPGSKIKATDLNTDMIEYAKTNFPSNSLVSWQTADAMNLPFDKASFDAVICQFGVMFFPDKAAAFSETHRVLQNGGTFMFNTWGSIETNPVTFTANEVVRRIYPENPPDFYQIPFSFYDKDEIYKLLSEAGFKSINIETIERDAKFESAANVSKAFVDGNPMIVQLRERDSSRIPIVKNELEKAIIEKYGDNHVMSKGEAIVCTAEK